MIVRQRELLLANHQASGVHSNSSNSVVVAASRNEIQSAIRSALPTGVASVGGVVAGRVERIERSPIRPQPAGKRARCLLLLTRSDDYGTLLDAIVERL